MRSAKWLHQLVIAVMILTAISACASPAPAPAAPTAAPNFCARQGSGCGHRGAGRPGCRNRGSCRPRRHQGRGPGGCRGRPQGTRDPQARPDHTGPGL